MQDSAIVKWKVTNWQRRTSTASGKSELQLHILRAESLDISKQSAVHYSTIFAALLASLGTSLE